MDGNGRLPASRFGIGSDTSTNSSDAPAGSAPGRITLPILGIAVRFEVADAALAAAVEAAYGAWRGVGVDAADAAPLVTIRVAPQAAVATRPAAAVGAPAAPAEAPRIRAWNERLTLDGEGVRAAADARRRRAWCRVDPALAADGRRLRSEALDTLLLFLLTRLDRQPLHAACVALGDVAAVLAGPPGAGKSTLAWEAARAGLRVVSEDAVYIQLEPRLRVWGWPGAIHLAPADAERLPESAMAPLRIRGGRWKHALDSAALAPAYAERALLFVLRPGADRAAASPLPVERAVRELATSLEPGFDVFRRTLPAAIRALAAGGCHRLALSGEGAAAIEVVRAVIESGGAGGAGGEAGEASDAGGGG